MLARSPARSRRPGPGAALGCDVTKSEDIQAALGQTVESFGQLDIAFNNAGIEQPVKPTVEVGEEEWNRLIATNLTSVFHCRKHEIPLMLESGGGRSSIPPPARG